MAATPCNFPAGQVAICAEFPDAAQLVGVVVFHTGFGDYFVPQGGAWRPADAGAFIRPRGDGVDANTAVVVVAGVAELLDASVHDHSDGVVQSVHGGDALVRWQGLIHGFSDLVPGGTYVGTNTPGVVSLLHDPGNNLIEVFRAVSDTSARIHLERPILT